MREFGSSVLENRREGSGLVMVLMEFLMKGRLSEESGLRRGRTDETSAARSRKVRGFEHPKENMLIYGGNGGGTMKNDPNARN